MEIGITAYPAILVLVTILADAIKASPLPNEWIPTLCAAAGAVIGVVAMFVVPDFPASDFLTAAAIGGISGLAAVGVNQIEKQVEKVKKSD